MLDNIKGITVEYDRPLAGCCSMGTGGPCDYFVTAHTPPAVAETIRALRQNRVPYYVIGGGTNLLISDRGFRGAFIKLGTDFEDSGETGDGCFVCGCASTLTAAAKASLEAGFVGLHEVGAIPGSLGGALYMNAGESYGDIGRFVRTVDVYDTEKDLLCTLEAAECGYEYRNSVFQKNPGRYVLLSAVFDMPKARDAAELKQAAEDLSQRLLMRRDKFPPYKSAGCFFKNTETVQAGRLIERCGLKELSCGGAGVAKEHANFIINKNGATASDVYSLAMTVRDRVLAETGIALEPEVRLVGDFSPKRVAVLMGGLSSERSISLVTGYEICKALDKNKYSVCGIDVAELRPGWKKAVEKYPVLEHHREQTEEFYRSEYYYPASILLAQENERPEVCFIALHGRYGEDGCVQGLLEILGIPYTGSGVLAHAQAIDKIVSKEIYRQNGIPVAPSVEFSARSAADALRLCSGLNYPVFVKPACQGSTIGMTMASCDSELAASVAEAARYDNKIMVEEYVAGTEITVAVLDTPSGPVALPAVEIVPPEGLYDLEAKYIPGKTTEICPARISGAAAEETGRLAVLAHRALGCRGISRTDIIVKDDGGMAVLETNTIPGMTPTSLVPRALGAAGISFGEFLDIMIAGAQNETQ
ncbi:MAG: UDP-N-acetylmuramate dehydrogenase [Abditibacteriota bacterium]|nr:UDP-N-acetylmuramate dehydrogenase [Abditibacteriota bacterium]